ncbi:NAD-dependent protein deacetylase of SIR2 family [Lachnospiraceae bacterium TWA4]|nr:NAD-dependent protein deacetylase of SIR2 family [Lachnospiraceae bacterium TWA4]
MIYRKRQFNNIEDQITKLKHEIETTDAILIGAGSGLSTAAGHTYTGERFEKYFSDFIKEFGVRDMYSGGAYPFPDKETYWGWVARLVYVNRYMPASNDTYERLLDVVKDKDYFAMTTNVDHCFQQAGFDKKRLWYVQGDYGLFQCSDACHDETYDNYDAIVKNASFRRFP